jgi:hypothetical protein
MKDCFVAKFNGRQNDRLVRWFTDQRTEQMATDWWKTEKQIDLQIDSFILLQLI